MGKIIVKAQQQNVFNKDKSGVTSQAYVLRPIRYSTMRADDIVNYCAANSIVPKAYLNAAMVAVSQCITNFLLNGHSVEFPGLGIFSLSSKGISETDANKAGIAQLTKLNVRFLPCSALKNEVDLVDLEFDGVYDIAGETAEGEKYYRKVARTLAVSPTPGAPTPTPSSHTVTLSASPANGGSVSGAGSYQHGASATIAATANSGYTFTRWSDGSTQPSRTLAINDNLTLQAIFTANTPSGSGDEEE